MGDRKHRDALELFVQNLLSQIRQEIKEYSGLEGMVATVSLECINDTKIA